MIFDLVAILFLGLFGAIAGFFGGMLGVGGGVIIIPLLILLFDLEARQAVGTSLVMIVFTALSATFAYDRQKRIDWKIGLTGATVTVPAAVIGAYATKLVSSKSLTVILGATLFLIAVTMLGRSFRMFPSRKSDAANGIEADSKPTRKVWNRRIVDAAGRVFEYDARISSGLTLLFLAGLASGFLGIGGGLIVVPVLAVVIGLPMHIAVATSMLTMILTSISGISAHVILGNVLIDYAIPIVMGIVLGAQLGATAAKRLRSTSLERAFALAVLAIGILLIISRL